MRDNVLFMPEYKQLRQTLNRRTLALLKTDLGVGFTFAQIALTTRDADKRERNRRNAQTAFDMVSEHAAHVEMSVVDAAEIQCGLARLKLALEQLGTAF